MTRIFTAAAHSPQLLPASTRTGSFADKRSYAMPNRTFGYLKLLPRGLVHGAVALAILPALGGAVRAQDHIMSTEYFDVALVQNYTEIWRDSGSRAKRDVFVLRPVPPAGFRTLGDVAIEGWIGNFTPDSYPYSIAIRPKPGRENLIAAPTGVVEKWSTDGTRANTPMKVYGLACPSGYAALGGFIQLNSDRAGDPNITCLSTSVLTPGAWAIKSIWDDKGTGADKDLSLWSAEFRGVGKPGTLIIPSTAMFPSTTYDPPRETAWALQLTHKGQDLFAAIPPDQVKAVHPTLTGPTAPMIPEGNLPRITYSLPFYQVQDPDLDFFRQWLESPVYTVERTTRFELVDMRDNTGNCDTGQPVTFTYTTSVGTETSDAWNIDIGASITVEGKGAFKPLGVGGELSVGVTASVNSGYERVWANSRGTEKSDQVVVPAGTAMALFKLVSDYRIFRQGMDIPMPNATASSTSPTLVPAYYRLPGWTKENGCPRSDALISGPASLEMGKRYYSESGAHNLMWDNNDFAIYTDSGHAVWKFSTLSGRTPWITSVTISEDGQITVMAGEKGEPVLRSDGVYRFPVTTSVPFELVKNQNRPKGTALYLTEDGALQVAAPNGRVVWDSLAK